MCATSGIGSHVWLRTRLVMKTAERPEHFPAISCARYAHAPKFPTDITQDFREDLLEGRMARGCTILPRPQLVTDIDIDISTSMFSRATSIRPLVSQLKLGTRPRARPSFSTSAPVRAAAGSNLTAPPPAYGPVGVARALQPGVTACTSASLPPFLLVRLPPFLSLPLHPRIHPHLRILSLTHT